MDFNSVFSSNYLAPIEYYHYLIQNNSLALDFYENFVKQTYRNRCYILSPNGVQNLTIPIIKARKKKPIKNVKISYDENWRKIHWKSLEAAYRSSPYFEFYEDDFHPFYHEKKYDFLIDLNWDLGQKIVELLNLDISIKKSTKYIDEIDVKADFRNVFSPKINNRLQFKEYIQVFSDRNGFAPNMSLVDLLFNEGPNALSYLKNLKENV